MKLPHRGNEFALLFSHSAFIEAQISTGTGSSSVIFQSQAPFPVPANSTSTTIVKPSTPLNGPHTTASSSLSFTSLSLATQTNDTVVYTSTIASSSKASTGGLNTSPQPSGPPLVSSITSSYTPSPVTSSTATFPPAVSSASNITTISSSSTGVTTSGDTSLYPTVQPTVVSSASNTASTILETSNSPVLPPGITIPPLPVTTLVPTGTEVQSSASDLSIAILGVFPILQNWIEDPVAHVTEVTDELDNIIPDAVGFLAKLPKPTDGVEPCGSGKRRRSEGNHELHDVLSERDLLGGLFKTAFSLVNCVINTTNKVKDAVIGGTTAAVDTVKGLQDDLKPLLDALNEVVPDEASEPSDSVSETEEPTQTSSSTCTLTTVSNCDIACTVTATTTKGGPNKRAQGDVCTTVCGAPITKCDVCTTVCGAPITKCDVTGYTSSSTVTSTTTATRQRCAPDCDNCNGKVRRLATSVPAPTEFPTAFESIAISSTTTIAVSHFRNPQLSAEGLAPVETGHPTSHVSKRSLSSPYGPEHNGDVGAWLLDQIEDSLNPYGSLEQGRGTTGLSFPLEDTADDWHLVNLWGCTSVVVISRKRMFLTHIWEKPSMEQPQLFQSEVLDVLRDGSREFPHGLTVFTVPGEGFENIAENKVRAFIITPYRDFAVNPASDDINYPYEVDKIKNLLNNILGRNDALIIPYSPAEENNREGTPKGKVYIQYDPAAAAVVPAEGGCNQQQAAAIELWFEDAPTYRYRDTWQPFPDQVVQAKKRSVASSGKDLRLLRGREVTDADEAEWKGYEALMKRQDGDTCARPSNSLSVSSVSPLQSPASTVPTPSTLRTTVKPSMSDSTSESSSPPPSSIATSPSSQSSITSETPYLTWTPAQPSTTESSPAAPKPSFTSQSPPAPQPKPPTKALSVIFRNTKDGGEDYNNWTFFETKPSTQADGCSVPVLNDVSRQWSDPSALSTPPWPHGTFTMPLFGEEDCEYLSDGTNPGVLHCPSMGDGKTVGCKEADEKDDDDGVTDCDYPGLERKVRVVVYCEW